jgi:integrase/recombinase XerD
MDMTILAAAASSWAVLMGIAPVLQIRRMMREQSSRQVSIGYFMILLVGFLLWIAYGAAAGILPLVIPNTVALLVGATVVLVALRLRRRPPREVHPKNSLTCRQERCRLHGDGESAQRNGMTTFAQLIPASPDPPFTGRLRLAVAAYLARFKGSSREHTESDLRCYLAWCSERGLDLLAARRPHLELYIRWMQEIRRFKPSAVSRRFSVTAGFYRTCVLDGTLEHSPAEHVRRPAVPAESPAPGFTHLQFEALLTAARQSPDRYDFALIVMLGLLGLRIFEATAADIADLGEEHGHRVLRVCGKGTKIVLVPLPPAAGRAIDQAAGTRTSGPVLLNSRGTQMDRHAATRRLRHLAETARIPVTRAHLHMLRHTFVTTSFDAGAGLRDAQIAARHADPRTTMGYDRARQNLDRHPNYILAAYMASGT